MHNALSNQFTQGMDTYPKTIEDAVWLLNNYKTTMVKQPAVSQHKYEEFASIQRGEQEHQRFSVSENTRENAKEAKHVKATTKKKNKRTTKVTCHNSDKKGHLKFDCKHKKNEDSSVVSYGSERDQLNFDEFDDDESCKSGEDIFNRGKYKDQDNILTDSDVDSIDDTLPDDSFVHKIFCNSKHRAEICRTLFLTERSCPDVLQAIILTSDASFGVNHHESGEQTVNIQDTYLDMTLI